MSSHKCGLLPNFKERPGLRAVLEQTFLLSFPVAIFVRGSLVVLLFALGQAQVELGAAFFPVQAQRDQRIAFAFDRTDQAVEFAAVQ